VTASKDKTVKVWSTEDGTCLQTLEGHKDYVRDVDVSPDGQCVASASKDKTVKVWRADGDGGGGSDGGGWVCVKTLSNPQDTFMNGCAFSPDGRWLAGASSAGHILLWDATSDVYPLVCTFRGHSRAAAKCSFSADSRLLVSTSHDQTVKVWRVANRTCLATLNGHAKVVETATLSRDGTTIASVSTDGTAKLWDVADLHLRECVAPRLRDLPTATTPYGVKAHATRLACLVEEVSNLRGLREVKQVVASQLVTWMEGVGRGFGGGRSDGGASSPCGATTWEELVVWAITTPSKAMAGNLCINRPSLVRLFASHPTRRRRVQYPYSRLLNAELAAATARHTIAMSTQAARHEAECMAKDTALAAVTACHAEAMNAQAALHTEAMKAQAACHEAECQAKDVALAAANACHAEAMKAQAARHEELCKAQAARYEEECSAKDEALAAANARHAEEMNAQAWHHARTLNAQLAAATARVGNASRRPAQAFHASIQRTQAAHAQELAALRQQHEDAMAQLQSRYHFAMQAMAEAEQQLQETSAAMKAAQRDVVAKEVAKARQAMQAEFDARLDGQMVAARASHDQAMQQKAVHVSELQKWKRETLAAQAKVRRDAEVSRQKRRQACAHVSAFLWMLCVCGAVFCAWARVSPFVTAMVGAPEWKWCIVGMCFSAMAHGWNSGVKPRSLWFAAGRRVAQVWTQMCEWFMPGCMTVSIHAYVCGGAGGEVAQCPYRPGLQPC